MSTAASTSPNHALALAGKSSADRKLNLASILANETSSPYSLADFEDFLRTREHSEENLDFLKAATAYRSEATANAWTMSTHAEPMKQAMLAVVQRFVVPGAPQEINCPNIVRKRFLDEVQSKGNYAPELLAPIEDKIFELMRLSSFPHFVRHVEQTMQLAQANAQQGTVASTPVKAPNGAAN
ncbi:hypothetical protein GGF32_002281 [Allomyces javanicus]|nr:hypothetical protein GGF32_002281 [Allomyces javanicus]